MGALLGGAGALIGGTELARVKVLGQALGGRTLQVGPVKAPNFPWVMLGRAWAHQRLVAERNHARREVMSLSMASDDHLMDRLPDRLRRDLAASLRRLTRNPADSDARRSLAAAVDELLAREP